MENRIERVDTIPLIIHWLMRMQVHKVSYSKSRVSRQNLSTGIPLATILSM
jgi:hypothetical protein